MAHNFTGDPKEYLKWWEIVILVYERRLQEQEELNGQRMSGWWWGDGGAYVVMFYCHGTYANKQKLRRTLHFSVWVVVGSGFFSRLSFPLKSRATKL